MSVNKIAPERLQPRTVIVKRTGPGGLVGWSSYEVHLPGHSAIRLVVQSGRDAILAALKVAGNQ